MKYQAENAVSSYFYYMWNTWCEEECKTVFKEMYPHFWEKWSLMTDKGVFGASDIIGISKIPLPNNRLSRCSLEISTKI